MQSLLKTQGVINEILSRGEREHKDFAAGWPNPLDGDGKPIYLLKLEPRTLRQIDIIEVTGKCQFDIDEFPLSRGRLGKTAVAWALEPLATVTPCS